MTRSRAQPVERMYLPPGFSLSRSIELARLIVQAYVQLDSFLKRRAWRLEGGYELIGQLYDATSSRLFAGAVTAQIRRGSPAPSAGSRQLGDVPLGFVARRGRAVFVIFRGTMRAVEWVRDLNVRLSDHPRPDYGRVHEGFLRTLQGLVPSLQRTLGQADRGKELCIAGHSLGAALAVLALPEVAAGTRYRSATLYTYACPRVGDKRFAAAFDRDFEGRAFRISNTSDVVVSLPLPVPVLGIVGGYFTEVGTPVVFTKQEEDIEKNHSVETYLSALLAAQAGNGFLTRAFRWRWAQR